MDTLQSELADHQFNRRWLQMIRHAEGSEELMTMVRKWSNEMHLRGSKMARQRFNESSNPEHRKAIKDLYDVGKDLNRRNVDEDHLDLPRKRTSECKHCEYASSKEMLS